VMRGFRMDPSITKQKLKPGTIRRIASYARPYRVHLAVFLLATAVDGLGSSAWTCHGAASQCARDAFRASFVTS